METRSLNEVVDRTRGAGIKGGLSLEVAIGHLGRHAEQQQAFEQELRMLHPVPITAPPMQLAAGAGVLNVPDLLGPHDGYYWDVRILAAQSFTAGTVTVYKNFQADENYRGTFTSAGLLMYSGSLMLTDSDALVFVAAGITGQVTISGEAYNIPRRLVGRYLL
jgi:hypothetical protein